MDKDHLVDLITSSIFREENIFNGEKSYTDMKSYLEKLDLEQLRTMSKEFIL